MKQVNPIDDIKAAIDHSAEQGHETKTIYIRKQIHDLILERTGCKNSSELLMAYRKKNPHQVAFTITIID